MKIKPNKLSAVPLIQTSVDSDKDLKFIPTSPLPKRGSLYICGAPGSGKSSLWYAMLLSKPTKKNQMTSATIINILTELKLLVTQ